MDGLASVISCSQEDAETYCEGAPPIPSHPSFPCELWRINSMLMHVFETEYASWAPQ